MRYAKLIMIIIAMMTIMYIIILMMAHRYRTLYAKLTESSHEDEESNEAQQKAASNPSSPPTLDPMLPDGTAASSPSPTQSFPQPSFQASKSGSPLLMAGSGLTSGSAGVMVTQRLGDLRQQTFILQILVQFTSAIVSTLRICVNSN